MNKFLILLLIMALCGLRFIHLGADTPISIADDGLHIDEGYKTLSPRNMVLFGSERWHPDDGYPGWMARSPLTQWPYFAAYKTLGVNIKSARAVTILWFLLLLCGYALAMRNRYPPALFFSGLIALGLQSTLFFFSRVALFEVPILTCLYLILFATTRLAPSRRWPIFVLLCSGTLVASLFIKLSAIIYFTPIILSSSLISLGEYKAPGKKYLAYMLSCGAVLLVLLLAFFAQDIWVHRFTSSLRNTFTRLIIYPPLAAAPFIVVMGLFVTSHGLLAQPRKYVQDYYRAGLMGIILICPLMLACFPYNQLRYYLPILPAYIFLILEWIHLGTWREPIKGRPGAWMTITVIAILFLLVFYGAGLVNLHLLPLLPLHIGDDPGISSASLVKTWPLIILLSLLVFLFRQTFFSKKMSALFFGILSLLLVLKDGELLGRFFFNPSYRSAEIGKGIAATIPPGAIVAGNWAPFLLLNTELKLLYMNFFFNRSSIELIHPDYLLYEDGINSTWNMKSIIETSSAKIGEPVYTSQYNEKKVILYPIEYRSRPERP